VAVFLVIALIVALAFAAVSNKPSKPTAYQDVAPISPQQVQRNQQAEVDINKQMGDQRAATDQRPR
jgi:hypothetical protein